MLFWFKDRALPLLIVILSAASGLLWWIFSPDIITILKPNTNFLDATTSPSTVTGADLVADLLTISALTVSICIAYLCLPRDRVEVKFATLVKLYLGKELVEVKVLIEYVNSLPTVHRTPSCKFLCGLLSPLDGVGGWYALSKEDMESSLGATNWEKIRRYVDEHIDEQWIRLLIYGLCILMSFGFLDLLLRYGGLIKLHYSGFETGSIVSLVLINIGTGFVLLLLASGTHSGEANVVARIKRQSKK